ncbi:hypothetical protein BDZ45DRAFT_726609 [Acephala macrosclerotiorum]|nr:hypothetical protein BDZ45DRAFT_726609 [Acephala macrosclerotiorum]
MGRLRRNAPGGLLGASRRPALWWNMSQHWSSPKRTSEATCFYYGPWGPPPCKNRPGKSPGAACGGRSQTSEPKTAERIRDLILPAGFFAQESQGGCDLRLQSVLSQLRTNGGDVQCLELGSEGLNWKPVNDYFSGDLHVSMHAKRISHTRPNGTAEKHPFSIRSSWMRDP